MEEKKVNIEEIKCPVCSSKGFYTKKGKNDEKIRVCKKCGEEWKDENN